MRFIFNLLVFIIMSSTFILEYMKTKRIHKLLGIGIIAYFFLFLPTLEKLNINQTLISITTIIMVILSFTYAYVEFKNTKHIEN